MEYIINQIVASLIISEMILYWIIRKKAPNIEIVFKICSGTLLLIVATICLIHPFYPALLDWLKQASIPIIIVGALIFALVIQTIWSKDSLK